MCASIFQDGSDDPITPKTPLFEVEGMGVGHFAPVSGQLRMPRVYDSAASVRDQEWATSTIAVYFQL
jgi:hypothetical protein